MFRIVKLLIALGVVSLVSNAFASLTVSLDSTSTGQPIGYRYPNSSGGEFTALLGGDSALVDSILGNYASHATVSINGQVGIETFCIAFNQPFSPGQTYTATIDTGATPGGVSGSVDGTDPISIGTAYLYSQFAEGTLRGFTYAPGRRRELASAELQDAIWFLEGEISNGYRSGGYTFYSTTTRRHRKDPFLALVERLFGGLAGARADANGAYDVYALNLTSTNGTFAQAQLVYMPNRPVPSAPVPEPANIVAGAILLLPLGISAYRIIRRKPSLRS